MSRRNPGRTTGKGIRDVPARYLSPAKVLERYLATSGATDVDTILKYWMLQGFSESELRPAAASLAVEMVPGGPGEGQVWRLR
jgi:hypothetical protein